jgi:two-component system chemotaxis response regulator CheB
LTERIEQSLWDAVRSIQESTMLMRHLAEHLSASQQQETAALLWQKAQEAERRAELVRQVLMNHEKLSEDKAEKRARD